MILVSYKMKTRHSASISMNAPPKMAAVESTSASILMEAIPVSVILDTSLIPSKQLDQRSDTLRLTVLGPNTHLNAHYKITLSL